MTHGIKSDGETLAFPTQAAIEKIKHYAEKITRPAKVLDLFRKRVFKAHKEDYIKTIIPEMKKYGYSNIPVYDENENFVGILNDSRLLYWISDLLINEDYLNLELTKIGHIQLEYGWKDYRFISQDMTIFEA
ncbi:CBS domain-containing protein [bacterium]|nr:CBS domain-containing protein [bacterium]